MNRLSQWLAGNRDIVMVLVVMGVLIVLFMPIPPAALDFLILANFSFAFLILLLTFYMTRPVEFSTFPSLLLIATDVYKRQTTSRARPAPNTRRH